MRILAGMTKRPTFSASAAPATGASATTAPGRAGAAPATSGVVAMPFDGARVGNVHDILPEPARSKFLSLKDEASDLHQLLLLASDEAKECFAREQQVASDLRRHEAVTYNRNVAEIARLEAKLAGIVAERQRHEARRDTRATEWQPKARIVSRLEDYLKSAGTVTIAAPVEVTVSKGKTFEAALADCREKIAAVVLEKADAESAPNPSSHAKESMRAVVEKLAARGEPNPLIPLESANPWQFRTGFGRSSSDENIDILGTLVWALKDQIIAKAEAAIDAAADDGDALTPEERKTKLAELDATLLALEREEEALFVKAVEAGARVERRRDADPRAILGVEGRAPRA